MFRFFFTKTFGEMKNSAIFATAIERDAAIIESLVR